ncbi:hypothetical protein [Paramicrobacterium fandaimingii]|nr:hypothetical protein [Microbacterium fandaimingii]
MLTKRKITQLHVREHAWASKKDYGQTLDARIATTGWLHANARR